MTLEKARALAEFIKDHDKRFEAKAAIEEDRSEGDRGVVHLTLATDGTKLEPIADIADYQEAWIKAENPGPTVQAAWEKWQPQE